MWSVDTPPPVPPYNTNGMGRKCATLPQQPWDAQTVTTSPNNNTLRFDRWPMGNDVIAVRTNVRKPWSWCTLSYAIFSCCCCNIGGAFFGSLSIIIAMLSYTDHKATDYHRASKKRRTSLCLSSVGVVLGLIGITILLLIYFLVPSVNEAVNNALTSFDIKMVSRNVTSEVPSTNTTTQPPLNTTTQNSTTITEVQPVPPLTAIPAPGTG